MLTTRRTITRKTEPCPRCGTMCKQHSIGHRTLHDIGGTLEVNYSKHYCRRCNKFFSAYMDHIAAKGCRYTRRVVLAARDMVIHQSMTLDKAAARMLEKHHVRVPETTLHEWVREEVVERVCRVLLTPACMPAGDTGTERRAAYDLEGMDPKERTACLPAPFTPRRRGEFRRKP